MKLNCCYYSSFVFIVTIVIGLYCKYYLYSFLFLILLITSLIHHSSYTDFTYVLDKIVCLYIVVYGILLFYQKNIDHFTLINTNNTTILDYVKSSLFIVIVILFLSVLYLYYYGHYTKQYVFDPDIPTSFRTHSFIHYMSAFAHSLIMIL